MELPASFYEETGPPERRVDRIREWAGRHRTGLVAAAVLAVVVIVVTLTMDDSTPGDAERGKDGRITRAGYADLDGLREGDCFDTNGHLASVAAGRSVTRADRTVKAVPCTDPHDGEVFAVVELDGKVPHGGTPQAGADFCGPRKAAYLGRSSTPAGIVGLAYAPAADPTGAGDPRLLCIFGSFDTRTTGALRG